MLKSNVLLTFIGLSSISCLALAFDQTPLQDFCVAKATTTVKLNGLTCKDPDQVHANDFYFSGLHIPGNTSVTSGFSPTLVSAAELPGLNTLGISLVRFDYAEGGVSGPHTHPRATEILTVLEGVLEVGFVNSNPENKLFVKVLQKGDVFVFPVGLIHFQRNVSKGKAVAIAGLNSQNPGIIGISRTVFGSGINRDVLAKAFQIDGETVDAIVSKF